ncbi:MAG: hypothetical protein QOH62_1638 [Solirubrobacteraceae bacterium]|jgi:hypothetical protein|nr:hypothetical protein [Solirubrobacteraceae bacterium]
MAVQLLVYGFGSESDFSGKLVGALERLESGGALRIADALFVQSDAETRELAAVDLGGRRVDAMVATLLEFRLDPGKRRRTTERALAGDATRALAEALEPGTALVAVLVEHVWAEALEDAVARTGGAPLHGDFVDVSDLTELTDELVSAARGLASTNP